MPLERTEGPVKAGTRLGPYEVIARIGAGGMGEVWRARDTRLDRDVAVKILPSDFATDARLKARFEREAKTISHLSHPNICALFDVGDDYLVMELLDGESLAERIARTPLPVSDAIRFGTQMAEALGRAHREGVIHRDFKPANVVLTRSGAKLLDFGLAKTIGVGALVEAETIQKPLTETGVVLGTFQYMAPEQIAGAEADARSDIFALGAVLYEMVTGRPAFQGRTRTSLIAAIVGSDPPPLPDLVPLAPVALDHVIRKCLEKDPDRRWQSADDVAEELRWIGGGSGASPRPTTRRSVRSRVVYGVAAVLAIAGIAAAAFLIGGRTGKGPDVFLSIAPSTAQYDHAFEPWISPDGKRVVFSAVDKSNKLGLWVRSLDRFEAAPLNGTENGRWAFWSADSRSIFFIRAGKLFRVAFNGGPVQELASAPVTENWGGACNEAGVVLFSTGWSGLHRIDPGGTPRDFTKLDRAKFEIGHVFPTFLPDGKRFLYIALIRNPHTPDDTNHLCAGSVDSEQTTCFASVTSRVQYDPAGYLLMVRDGSLVAIPFDARRLRVHGDAIPIAFPVSYFKVSARGLFSLSRNGTVIFTTPGTSGALQWLSPEGGVRRAFSGRELVPNGALRVSPDGHNVLLANVDLTGGTTDLWLWGLDRDTQTRLTYDARVEMSPVFSADGTHVYFGSDVAGFPDIYERTIGGTENQFVVGGPGYQMPSDTSPDGRYLLYRTTENSPANAYNVLRLDESGARPFAFVVTPSRLGASPRFSPDGKSVAYYANDTGKFEAYVKPFPGPAAARQITSGGAMLPQWSADGKRIYFIRGDRSIYFTDVDRALNGDLSAQKAIEFPADINDFALLRDGGYLVHLDNGTDGVTNVITNWTRLLPR